MSMLEPVSTEPQTLADKLELQFEQMERLERHPDMISIVRSHWRQVEPYKSNLNIEPPKAAPPELLVKLAQVAVITNPDLNVHQ